MASLMKFRARHLPATILAVSTFFAAAVEAGDPVTTVLGGDVSVSFEESVGARQQPNLTVEWLNDLEVRQEILGAADPDLLGAQLVCTGFAGLENEPVKGQAFAFSPEIIFGAAPGSLPKRKKKTDRNGEAHQSWRFDRAEVNDLLTQAGWTSVEIDPVSNKTVDLLGGACDLRFFESCESGPTTVCLRGGRYKVETFWRDNDGVLKEAEGEDRSNDRGTFWFFLPDDIEVEIRILDRCRNAREGFNSFWAEVKIFTPLEVTVEVTDLHTGVRKTYFKDVVDPAGTTIDKESFMTCP